MKDILVVDDDDGTTEAIADLLRDEGYRAFTASTGKEALRWLGHSRPELLITDLYMPDMDGWQLLDHLGANPELDRLPTVVMTAWPRPVELPEGISLIKKPFDWDTLLCLVRKHCGEATSQQRLENELESRGDPREVA
jgi:two-component system sensor histidine kinase/response regulator